MEEWEEGREKRESGRGQCEESEKGNGEKEEKTVG